MCGIIFRTTLMDVVVWTSSSSVDCDSSSKALHNDASLWGHWVQTDGLVCGDS